MSTSTGTEGALEKLRTKTPGARFHDTTLLAVQYLVKQEPDRAWDVMRAVRAHLPHFKVKQQLLLGRALFGTDPALSGEFVKALGLIPSVVRSTLEGLVDEADMPHMRLALERVEGLGGAETMTFQSRVARRGLAGAMSSKTHPQGLASLVMLAPGAKIQLPHQSQTHGWWAAALLVFKDSISFPVTQGLERALDLLLDCGVGPGADAVDIACTVEDAGAHGALKAVLDRGAEWEGRAIPDRLVPTLQAHPCWRRVQLGTEVDRPPGRRSPTRM